jgi:hypothetical protein
MLCCQHINSQLSGKEASAGNDIKTFCLPIFQHIFAHYCFLGIYLLILYFFGILMPDFIVRLGCLTRN